MNEVVEWGLGRDDGEMTAPRRSLKFTSVATGAVVSSYDFARDVFAGDISPTGTQFAYQLTTMDGSIGVNVASGPAGTALSR